MATEGKLREYLRRATAELTDSRRQLADVIAGNTEPLAIIGMACRYPGAASVEDYWQLLRDGRSGVVEVPAARWDVADYYNADRRVPGAVYTRHGAFLSDIAGWDAEFFGVSPHEALRMDPNQRLLMELVWEGLESAGIPPTGLGGSRTGVMVGLMDTSQYGRIQVERYGPEVAADPYFGQGAAASVIAGRLAYHYDLRGPAITLDTACSSSLVGIHLAAQALRRGECDLAVAAGVYLIIHPDTYIQGCATSMLAPDGRCKTFDAGADGYVLGEGGGLVVLERLSDALAKNRPIRAVLRGSAVNQDGRSNGLSAPSRSAQVDVIRRALADAGVSPDQVGYVEAHGSGTQLGDAIELSALHDVFGGRSAQRPLHVGAVKTNIGHTQSAAGIAGLIKTVLLLEHRQAPANLNCGQPSDAIPADGTVQPVLAGVELAADGSAIAGVSGFGWSGTNGHLVVAGAPAVAAEAPPAGAESMLLPVSAASPAALGDQLRQLSDWLTARPELALSDVAHTLRTGRAALDHRRAVLATDAADASRRLAAAAKAPGPGRRRVRPRLALLLPGIGDQYAGLGRELYRADAGYAGTVDRCIELVEGQSGLDLRPLFFPAEDRLPLAGDLAALIGRGADQPTGPDPMAQAEFAHPFQFIVCYALARLLAARGVRPDLLLGYSLGEYVAACLAGVFTLPDALQVVVERARLIATAPAGGMVSVAAGEATVRAMLAGSPAEVDIAALNGPAMTVLSGPVADVEAVAEQLLAAGLACRPLRTEHAFHSGLLEPVRDKLAAVIESVPRQAPTVAIMSNRDGAELTAEQAMSSEYWADHLVQPVRFAQSVASCAARGIEVYLELGAGQTLGGLVRQNLTGGAAVLGTLPARWTAGERPDEAAALLSTCGQLWELGVAVELPGAAGRIVELPKYPFQRSRFWPDGAVAKLTPGRPAEPVEICYTATWRQDLTPPAPARPAGTLVLVGEGAVADALAGLATEANWPVLRDVGRLPADTGPVQLVHLDALRAGSEQPVFAADGELADGLTRSFDSLLLSLQAAGATARERGVQLLTVTRGALEVLGGDAVAPIQSAAHGLGRTARHEYPGLTWRGVDLDPALTDPIEIARQLYAELLAGPTEAPAAVTGWRRDRRWLQDWAELSTAEQPAVDRQRTPVWRPDGVYLITGGTRGLGLALARHLVAAGVRRLALVSRGSSRPDLSGMGEAEVLQLRADVSRPDQLRSALRHCREHYGALDGVLHVAGVPASGMLERQTVAGAHGVLEPKVLALGPLAELVGPSTPADQRPELLVLYSSAITAFGGIGEGDYCAANTVLDAYGAALSALAPDTRVLSVAWGPWLHDDWQLGGPAGGLADRARDYRARYGFSNQAGLTLLDRLIRTRAASVVAVRQPMADAMAEWSAMLDLDSLVGAGSTTPTDQRFPRPQLRTEFVAARTDTELAVAEVWQAYLGIEQVGVHDPFFDLGGNSLVGMAMVRAVETALGVRIAPAVLFEHPTVAEFAAALDRPDENVEDLLSTSSDRGQRRRRARTGGRK
jgi:acyl transferase domain-containing protein